MRSAVSPAHAGVEASSRPHPAAARQLRARGGLHRHAVDAAWVRSAAQGPYCTRVGCYWKRVGATPRGSGVRAVRTTFGQ